MSNEETDDLMDQLCDHLSHRAMDDGDPGGKLRDFVEAIRHNQERLAAIIFLWKQAAADRAHLTSELERTREERDSANENRDYWRGRAEPAELEASNLRFLALTAEEREALIWLREWDGQHTPNSETNRAKHVAALDALDRLIAGKEGA